ncbi:ATP-binding protein [Streptomyces sp. NPDC057690]|uniref:ATP-binding protein n=1 Tax=Streptomyces sp. NPDC057690 TaxID=3346214 RepID=UPI00369F8AD9
MNSEISTQISTQGSTQGSTRDASLGELTLRLSATPRGARLARRLTGHQLSAWGHPHGSDANHTAQQVVAELAANAVTHGRVPGRDFELRLRLLPQDTLRVEVSDARADRRLRIVTNPEEEGGRGLILVWVLARTWGVAERDIGKTVWAELPLGS